MKQVPARITPYFTARDLHATSNYLDLHERTCVWQDTIKTPPGNKKGVISELPMLMYAFHESGKHKNVYLGL